MKNKTSYKRTRFVDPTDESVFRKLHPGQWIKTDMGQRGQFLGVTDRGTVVIRWQHDNFKRIDATNNKHLRNFAKTYGSQ